MRDRLPRPNPLPHRRPPRAPPHRRTGSGSALLLAGWGRSSALAGWELVGEPETSLCDTSCRWQQQSCPADATATLRTFFDAAGSRVRAIDPDTPIWAGFAGGGQCGTAGDDYTLVASSPLIGILDVHDYGPAGVLLAGDRYNGVQRRLQQAAALGKPLVVAEVGQPAGSCRPLTERATYLAQKVQAQRRAGSAGVLLWAYVPDPRPNECTMDIGPGDPLFGALRSCDRQRTELSLVAARAGGRHR